jgi:hypothetical protein
VTRDEGLHLLSGISTAIADVAKLRRELEELYALARDIVMDDIPGRIASIDLTDPKVRADILETASDECVCRTQSCGHPTSFHSGPGGECVVCKKKCWT